MKKIISFFLFAINLFHSQTIRPLNAFYTTPHFFNTEDIGRVIYYYKDTFDYYTPFLGNWKYTNGNKTFVLTLWKVTKAPNEFYGFLQYYKDEIYGHYTMYQDYGTPNQEIIYTSNMNIGSTSQVWETALTGNTEDGIKFHGVVWDIVGANQSIKYPEGISCYFDINISNTTPLTASWSLLPQIELFPSDKNSTLVIPNFITLTKQ